MKVKFTMMGPMLLIIRCLKRIRRWLAPRTFAAMANSCCLRVSTWLRTKRAMPTQEEIQIPTSTEYILAPKTTMIKITYIVEGIA